jgi:hypothetical protein
MKWIWLGSEYVVLADWLRDSRQDANSIYEDPLFLDALQGKFSLLPDSVAIDSGVATRIFQDFEGQLVPNGMHADIGAYEFSGCHGEDFDSDRWSDICDEDIDNDNVVNAVDFCDYTPSTVTADADGYSLGDLDRDCDTDLKDFALFQLNLTGPVLERNE